MQNAKNSELCVKQQKLYHGDKQILSTVQSMHFDTMLHFAHVTCAYTSLHIVSHRTYLNIVIILRLFPTITYLKRITHLLSHCKCPYTLYVYIPQQHTLSHSEFNIGNITFMRLLINKYINRNYLYINRVTSTSDKYLLNAHRALRWKSWLGKLHRNLHKLAITSITQKFYTDRRIASSGSISINSVFVCVNTCVMITLRVCISNMGNSCGVIFKVCSYMRNLYIHT